MRHSAISRYHWLSGRMSAEFNVGPTINGYRAMIECQNCGLRQQISTDNLCTRCRRSPTALINVIDETNPSVGTEGLQRLVQQVRGDYQQRRGDCQLCQADGPVTYGEFHEQMGAVIVRQHNYVQGNFCKRCFNREFLKRTSVTVIFGWWGIISFFANPFFIGNNLVRFAIGHFKFWRMAKVIDSQ